MPKSEIDSQSRAVKLLNVTITVIAVAMVVYQISNPFFLFFDPQQYMNIHLGFALVLIFLTALKSAKRAGRLLIIALLLSALVGIVYVHLFYADMELRSSFPLTIDVILGIIIIIAVFETTRRAFGLVLPIVGIVFLSYVFVGRYLSGAFKVASFSLSEVVARTCVAMEGIYGNILSMSANYIFLFILFGALLQATGTTQFIMQFGRLATRRVAGGGALMAVVTSCLVGMITGSALANITTTGSFTIPLMKRLGYRPEQAGAIEATASTGGQIMPPVMGAVALVMVGIAGIPYVRIMAAAIIPALLYFFSAGAYTVLWGQKMKLAPQEETVSPRTMLMSAPPFVGSLVFLTIYLVQGHSLGYTMALTLILLIILSLVTKECRSPFLRGGWLTGSIQGATTGAEIAVSCGLVGLMVACVQMTGLGLKLPSAIYAVTGGELLPVLLLTMLVCLVLTCGLPSVAAYILVVTFIAPVLFRIGITMLQAHMFVFYFAMLSIITPPVAAGAILASKLAGAPFFKTATEAMKVAIGALPIPFLMIYCPGILLLPDDLPWLVAGLIGCVIAILAAQAAVCGYYLGNLSSSERWLSGIVAVLLMGSFIARSTPAYIIPLVVFSGVTAWQWRKQRRWKFPQYLKA